MTQTVFKPRSPGNNWAYWKVTNLDDLPEATKRRRTMISFIPTDEALEGRTECCAVCKERIVAGERNSAGDTRGVRGEYLPKTRQYVLMHYDCAWSALLNQIFDTARRIG